MTLVAARRAPSALLLLLSILVPGASAYAEDSDGVFTFQARVTQNGTPLESAGLQLTFQIYEAGTGGTALWTETHSSVPVTNGVLCVELGQTTAIGDTFTVAQGSSQDRYVAVRAGGATDPEIVVPRVKLTAVPYTLTADMAVGIDDGTGTSLAITDLDARYGDGKVLPSHSAGRISVSSTDTAPASATGATIYYLQHRGKLVSLYHGGDWKAYDIPVTPLSKSLSGQTANLPYDLFANPTSNTAFELTPEAWASSTARQTGASVGIEQLDGVWVHKSGTTNRQRYLGTVYWTGTAINDTPTVRDVWNIDNQVDRVGFVVANFSVVMNTTAWTALPGLNLVVTVGLDDLVRTAGVYAHWSNGPTLAGYVMGWYDGAPPPHSIQNYTPSIGSSGSTSTATHLVPASPGRHTVGVAGLTSGYTLTAAWGMNRISLTN